MNETFQAQVTRLRRQQISTAAIRVFSERGFHGATIRDVAREAGVADGTIYNYFANKTALLLSILDPRNESGSRDTVPGPVPLQDEPTDIRQFFLQHFAHRWAAFSGDNLNVLRIALSEALVNPELCTLFVEQVISPAVTLAEPYFQQKVAAGELRAVNVPLTLRAITAAFLGFVMLRLMGDQSLQDQWDDVPEFLTGLLLDGMMPEKPKDRRKGDSFDDTF